MTQRYPDDFEAWTYYALTLQASAPKNDKTYAYQLKSAEILERLFKQNPEHPGVAHYLVHAYDYPPLAEKGIKVARRCTRRSRRPRPTRGTCPPTSTPWWECGRTRSPRIARRSSSSPTTITRPTSSSMPTCSLAQDARAKKLVDAIVRRCPSRSSLIVAVHTAVAAIPARYALERGDWAGAAALPVTADRARPGRLARPLCPRARHGAQRRPRRRQARGPGDAGAARCAGEGEPVVLGRSHGRANAGRLGLDRPRRRLPRPGR